MASPGAVSVGWSGVARSGASAGASTGSATPRSPASETIAAVSKRIPGAIVCLLTALHVHAIANAGSPRRLDRARPQGAQAAGFGPARESRALLGTDAPLRDRNPRSAGVPVRLTSPARTVVDCFPLPQEDRARHRNSRHSDTPSTHARRPWTGSRAWPRSAGSRRSFPHTWSRLLREGGPQECSRIGSRAPPRVVPRAPGGLQPHAPALHGGALPVPPRRHREHFVLKGAMLLALWGASLYRATRDLDLTGYTADDSRGLIAIMQEICAISCPQRRIHRPRRSRQNPSGTRASTTASASSSKGLLGTARLNLQIDVGFGNAISRASRARRGLSGRSSKAPRPASVLTAAKRSSLRSFTRRARPGVEHLLQGLLRRLRAGHELLVFRSSSLPSDRRHVRPAPHESHTGPADRPHVGLLLRPQAHGRVAAVPIPCRPDSGA